ncbi:MAG: carboxypeptidase Taq [Verrucomicrobiota bacterium]|nr:carboxypeptidase Taq [Verrucomicrobiota bacterium]
MSAYQSLRGIASEVALITSTESVLGWDQETYMPEKALGHRAQQLSYLSGKAHGLLTASRTRKLLERAEAEEPENERQKANVQGLRRLIDRATKLPQRFVEEEKRVTTRAKAVWAEARRQSDFSRFAPKLEMILGLARRKAELLGYDDEPYDALLDLYERDAKTREVAALFAKMRPQLAAIARAAVARSKELKPGVLKGRYPCKQQQILNREIAESLGYDFGAGRIDTTAHPFCATLGPGDVRLTTRYDETKFLSSLFGVMHEAGHGLYEQGLPGCDYGLPGGSAASLGIHESQSRLWENHVGRSRLFWTKWLPRAQELFPHLKKVKLDAFMQAILGSEFSFIRVEADEATYDLHILLRFGLERRLVRGALDVKDVPRVWNEEYRELFGRTPPDDRHGCLQDIHWSMGGLGYFATYTLGNINAAQLFAAARRQRNVAAGLERSDYAPLLKWLRENVHAHGAALTPTRIMQQATGRPADPKWHIAHLRERYLG